MGSVLVQFNAISNHEHLLLNLPSTKQEIGFRKIEKYESGDAACIRNGRFPPLSCKYINDCDSGVRVVIASWQNTSCSQHHNCILVR